jgi:hypothetical protein
MKTKLIFHFFIYLIMILLFNNFLCSKEIDPFLDCSDKRDRVLSSGELLTDGSGQWYMNVANVTGGTYIAEKNCHAKMKLTFMFLNDELSKTARKPPILVIFFGGDGFFDPGSVSYSSRLNSSGYYIWTASCDQAAKNASENPTNFGMSVTWDPEQYPKIDNVLLTGEIDYKIYEPE